jgi:restriction system protein
MCGAHACEGLRGQSRRREACSASLRRSAGTPTPLRCSVSWPVAELTPLTSFRYVQTGGDKSVHEARCARGPRALRSSAPKRHCAHVPPAALLAAWSDDIVQGAAHRLASPSANRIHRFARPRLTMNLLKGTRVLSPAVPLSSLPTDCPVITLNAQIVVFGDPTNEGTLIEALGLPWFKIVEWITKDRSALYNFTWRQWEELIAGAYHQDGFDEVILTPRSGDLGRDVIAVKKGFGSIRILDQVKAYAPGNLVSANDVRAMLGVVTADTNCSKGVVTTTADFAPLVREDPLLKKFMPHRLELKSGPELITWLNGISEHGPSQK